jgi:hypothetical protein
MNPRFEMPEKYYFGGGTDTFVTPLALVLLLLGIGFLLWLPRKYALIPLLFVGLLLSTQVTIVFCGVHWIAFRVLLLAGWIRCLARREYRGMVKSNLDKVVLCWAFSNAIVFVLLWREAASVVNRAGFLFQTLGTYFLLRYFIRDKDDVMRVIKAFVLVFAIIAPLMLCEYITRYNVFSLVGAAAESSIRVGRFRAGGPFLHAIIAGTVGAVMLPLSIGLWQQGRKYHLIAGVGVISATLAMLTSASTTPILTYAAGLTGLLLFRARKKLRAYRWGFVLSLCGLQLVMKVPIWFLIGRVGGLGGGTGWHRAALVDNFIRHFGEWWLVGTQNNADWGYYMWDVDNAYVAAGIGGGLITFLLFIAVIVYAYKAVGEARKKAEGSHKELRLIWALGCALFANTIAYLGIVYFDQSIILWYALLAMIAALPAFLVKASVRTPQVTPRWQYLENFETTLKDYPRG